MRGISEEEEEGVTSFSNVLLLSDDVLSSRDGGEVSFGFGKDVPQMLCFDGGNQNDTGLLFSGPSSLARDSTVSSLDDKSSKANEKRTGSSDGHDRVCNTKPGKRYKKDQKKSSVKKANISERITTLQQLVSPYGKTDTASVLHETMGYIKFLQDQVEVLCSPYFKHYNSLDEEEDMGDVNLTMKVKLELKNFDLCLVPLAWTVHVANTNGADLWSSSILSHTVNH